MTVNWLEETNICINNTSALDLLNNLQANILKHHGRDHAWHVLLQFVPGKEAAIRNWISTDLAATGSGYITSAYEQLKAVQKRHEKSEQGKSDYDGGLITCFMLSAKGYDLLTGNKSSTLVSGTDIFTSMKDRTIKDPEVKSWEPAFQVDIHAMIILADDSRRRLRARLKKIKKQTQGFVRIISNQKGKILRNKKNRAIEHFGYEDGISQPSFLASDKKGGDKTLDVQPLKIVLVRDNGTTEKDCYGSFVVFRKLEQNVKAFLTQRNKLAEKLSLGNNPQLAGALAVGRFENGTPVTLFDEEKPDLKDKNNFNYDEDSSAIPKCPYHAHIRITNGRKQFIERIVRRGIPYDEVGRQTDLSDFPEYGVGLYFISYQASLNGQFETIQDWAEGGNVLGKVRGMDPIAGQIRDPRASQEWPVTSAAGRVLQKEELFKHVVTLLGGEYFFAPSIPFLAKISTL